MSQLCGLAQRERKRVRPALALTLYAALSLAGACRRDSGDSRPDAGGPGQRDASQPAGGKTHSDASQPADASGAVQDGPSGTAGSSGAGRDTGILGAGGTGGHDDAGPDSPTGTDSGRDAGVVCDPSTLDAGLRPVFTIAQVAKPTHIAVSGNDVYFASEADGAGAISKCSKDGCGTNAPAVVVPGLLPGIAMTIRGSTLYWCAYPDPLPQGPWHACRSCTLDALGACTNIQVINTNYSNPAPFAVDDQQLYVISSSLITTCPISGCGTVLTYLRPRHGYPSIAGIQVRASTLYFGSRPLGHSPALDTEGSVGAIYSCPASACNGGATLVAADAMFPFAIAVDDERLYWSSWRGLYYSRFATIRSCPRSGCHTAQSTLIVSGEMWPYGIAVDETHLYFTDYIGGRVLRVPKN
jgi:hypothetical protein